VFFLASGPLEDSIAMLVSYLGFSESQYGLFLSISTFTLIFAPTIISFISEKFGPYIVSIIGVMLGFLGAFFIGLNLFTSWVVFLFVYAVLFARESFNFSIGNKICASIDDDISSRFFAIRDLFLYTSVSIGLLVGSFIARQFGFLLVYFVFSFVFLLSCGVILYIKNKNVLSKVDEQISSDDSEDNPEVDKKNKRIKVKKILKQRAFIGFVLIDPLTSFYTSAMRFVPILGLSLGIDASNLMILIGVVSLINALGGLVLGHLFEKGRKNIYILDLIFDLFPAILFAFSQNATIFIIAYTISILRSIFSPISFAYFFDCFSEEDAPLALGILTSIGNATLTIMPFIVGILWVISHSLVFILSATAIIVATLIAIVILPAKVKKR